MKTVSTVLITIAKELAILAQNDLPDLQKDEIILKERLENGVYYREFQKDGITYIYQFNFRNKKSRISAVGGNNND